MLKRKLKTQEWILLALCVIVLAQNLSILGLHSQEEVVINEDGRTAIVPMHETLIAMVSKVIISFTPNQDSVEVKWYFLGWHKWGEYQLREQPIKVLGYTVEKYTRSEENGILVSKPNNYFYVFR